MSKNFNDTKLPEKNRSGANWGSVFLKMILLLRHSYIQKSTASFKHCNLEILLATQFLNICGFPILEYLDIIVLRCDESKNIIILKSFRSRSYNIEKIDAELLY